MTLTKQNSSALISGAVFINNNFEEEMEPKKSKKLIAVSEFPFAVKYNSVKYGDVFEEEGIAMRELLGSGKAIEATDENLKMVKAELEARKTATKEKK